VTNGPPRRPRTLTDDERAELTFRVTTERRLDSIEKRLNDGGQAFQGLRDDIHGLERKTAAELLELKREVAAEIKQVEPGRLLRRMWWILGVALVSAGVSWGTLQSTKTDRDEVHQIVQTASPYQFDRQRIARIVDRYDSDQGAAAKTMAEIRQELAAINSKLEQLSKPTIPPRRRRR
jgi:hypothetical protein